jgi:hypothetical protein
MTLAGEVPVRRTILRPITQLDLKKLKDTQGVSAIIPIDEFLELDRLPFKMTIGAMLKIAHYVQSSDSYEDAEEALNRDTRIKVKKDTMRFVANTVGKIIYDIDMARAERTFDIFNSGNLTFPEEKNNYDFYIECDGAMFHTRERDEENGLKWKENKLGMVFSSESFIRWKNEETGKNEKRIGMREYTAYAGKVDVFQKLLFDLALRNGYGSYKNTILLTDGAPWIKNMKDLLFPDAVHILDYFHLCENTYKFAKDYFDNNESLYKPWGKKLCTLLRNSQTKEAIDILKGLNKQKAEQSDYKLLNYIQNNINCIDYKTYEDNDWFIGSGAIESGNKTVLQERLKKSGMRWNVETARYIIALMVKVKSDLWETDVVKAVQKHYGVSLMSEIKEKKF